MTIHESLTIKRIARAVERDEFIGFCVFCGKSRGSCEGDAQEYPCAHCGRRGVYGAEELLERLS